MSTEPIRMLFSIRPRGSRPEPPPEGVPLFAEAVVPPRVFRRVLKVLQGDLGENLSKWVSRGILNGFRELDGGWDCLVCGEPEMDGYSVRNELWAQAMRKLKGGTYEELGGPFVTPAVNLSGRLHLECLEEVLGRELKIEDFQDLPINNGIKAGFRMAERVQARGE